MASGLQKLTSNVDDDNLCKNFIKIQTGDEVSGRNLKRQGTSKGCVLQQAEHERY